LEKTILLLDEEYWSSHRRLGGLDMTGVEVLFKESIKLFLFYWR